MVLSNALYTQLFWYALLQGQKVGKNPNKIVGKEIERGKNVKKKIFYSMETARWAVSYQLPPPERYICYHAGWMKKKYSEKKGTFKEITKMGNFFLFLSWNILWARFNLWSYFKVKSRVSFLPQIFLKLYKCAVYCIKKSLVHFFLIFLVLTFQAQKKQLHNPFDIT